MGEPPEEEYPGARTSTRPLVSTAVNVSPRLRDAPRGPVVVKPVPPWKTGVTVESGVVRTGPTLHLTPRHPCVPPESLVSFVLDPDTVSVRSKTGDKVVTVTPTVTRSVKGRDSESRRKHFTHSRGRTVPSPGVGSSGGPRSIRDPVPHT